MELMEWGTVTGVVNVSKSNNNINIILMLIPHIPECKHSM